MRGRPELRTGRNGSHFPIAKVDLQSGSVETLVLDVPFEGEVPEPKTNFWATAEGFHTLDCWEVGVTWLRIVDDTLEVVIGTPGKAGAVRFKLADLVGAVQQVAPRGT